MLYLLFYTSETSNSESESIHNLFPDVTKDKQSCKSSKLDLTLGDKFIHKKCLSKTRQVAEDECIKMS